MSELNYPQTLQTGYYLFSSKFSKASLTLIHSKGEGSTPT